jgi:hypothetical protein
MCISSYSTVYSARLLRRESFGTVDSLCALSLRTLSATCVAFIDVFSTSFLTFFFVQQNQLLHELSTFVVGLIAIGVVIRPPWCVSVLLYTGLLKAKRLSKSSHAKYTPVTVAANAATDMIRAL